MADETITTKMILEAEDHTSDALSKIIKNTQTVQALIVGNHRAIQAAADRSGISYQEMAKRWIDAANKTGQAIGGPGGPTHHINLQSAALQKASHAVDDYIKHFIGIGATVEIMRRSLEASSSMGRAMNRIGIESGMAGTHLDHLRHTFEGLSATSGKSAVELANNFRTFHDQVKTMGGDIEGTFRQIVDAATAADVPIKTLVDSAVTAIKELQLPLSEVKDTLDVWVKAIPASMMGTWTAASGRIIGTMKDLGFSVEDIAKRAGKDFGAVAAALGSADKAADLFNATMNASKDISTLVGRTMIPQIEAITKAGGSQLDAQIALYNEYVRLGVYSKDTYDREVARANFAKGMSEENLRNLETRILSERAIREEIEKTGETEDVVRRRHLQLQMDQMAGLDAIKAAYEDLKTGLGEAFGTEALKQFARDLIKLKEEIITIAGYLQRFRRWAVPTPAEREESTSKGIVERMEARDPGGGLPAAQPNAAIRRRTGRTSGAFAEGGAFTVGGQGGVDTQRVGFMATPGERVAITTPTQESLQLQQDKADIAQREHFARFHSTAFTQMRPAAWWPGGSGTQAGGGGGGGGGRGFGGVPAMGSAGPGGGGGSRGGDGSGGNNKGANDPPNTTTSSPPPAAPSWPEVQGPPQPPSRWHRSGQPPVQPPGGPAPGATTGGTPYGAEGAGGTFAGGDTRGVDPRLVAVIAEASKQLPKGWTAKLQSGVGDRPGGSGSYHPRGGAADVAIYNEKGQPITGPNSRAGPGSIPGWYQDPQTFRVYEQFAQNARLAQERIYPGQNFTWGGYFLNQGRGGMGSKFGGSGSQPAYGSADLMHMQWGGSMGGGSWESGATGNLRKWLESGGGTSVGLGSGQRPASVPIAGNIAGTPYGGGAPSVSSTPAVGAGGGNSYLAQRRAAIFAELDKDPATKAELGRVLATENWSKEPGAREAILERIANASLRDNKSIKQTLHSGFYAPINKPGTQRPDDPAVTARAIAAVRGGSDLIEMRTEQGMLGEHPYAEKQVGAEKARLKQIHGEWFSDQDERSAEWSKRELAAAAAAKNKTADAPTNTKLAGPIPTATTGALVSGDKRPGVTFPPGTSAATIAAHQKAVLAKAGGGRSELAAQRWAKRREAAAGEGGEPAAGKSRGYTGGVAAGKGASGAYTGGVAAGKSRGYTGGVAAGKRAGGATFKAVADPAKPAAVADPEKPGRAFGGEVKAGRDYGINELGWGETFRPKESGDINPAGGDFGISGAMSQYAAFVSQMSQPIRANISVPELAPVRNRMARVGARREAHDVMRMGRHASHQDIGFA